MVGLIGAVLGVGVDDPGPSGLIAEDGIATVFIGPGGSNHVEVAARIGCRLLLRFRIVGPRLQPGGVGHQKHIGSLQRQNPGDLGK